MNAVERALGSDSGPGLIQSHGAGAPAGSSVGARTETAVRLIHERGFSRDRDLQAALDEWRSTARALRSDT